MTAAETDRVQAPFGARAARVTATERHGAYVVLRGGGFIGYCLYLMGTEEFVKRNPDVVARPQKGHPVLPLPLLRGVRLPDPSDSGRMAYPPGAL